MTTSPDYSGIYDPLIDMHEWGDLGAAKKLLAKTSSEKQASLRSLLGAADTKITQAMRHICGDNCFTGARRLQDALSKRGAGSSLVFFPKNVHFGVQAGRGAKKTLLHATPDATDSLLQRLRGRMGWSVENPKAYQRWLRSYRTKPVAVLSRTKTSSEKQAVIRRVTHMLNRGADALLRGGRELAPGAFDVASGQAKRQLSFQKRQLLDYVRASIREKKKILGAENALRRVTDPRARSHIIRNVKGLREDLSQTRWLHGHLLRANKRARKMYGPYMDVTKYRPTRAMRKISSARCLTVRVILRRHFG